MEEQIVYIIIPIVILVVFLVVTTVIRNVLVASKVYNEIEENGMKEPVPKRKRARK